LKFPKELRVRRPSTGRRNPMVFTSLCQWVAH